MTSPGDSPTSRGYTAGSSPSRRSGRASSPMEYAANMARSASRPVSIVANPSTNSALTPSTTDPRIMRLPSTSPAMLATTSVALSRQSGAGPSSGWRPSGSDVGSGGSTFGASEPGASSELEFVSRFGSLPAFADVCTRPVLLSTCARLLSNDACDDTDSSAHPILAMRCPMAAAAMRARRATLSSSLLGSRPRPHDCGGSPMRQLMQ